MLAERGFAPPEIFSDESLRALWYPNVNGQKGLLISINGNRIFASRSRDLMEAIYDSSRDSRPMVTFLGSAGAIDAPELVGKIVAPTSVTNGDPFYRPKAMALSFIWFGTGPWISSACNLLMRRLKAWWWKQPNGRSASRANELRQSTENFIRSSMRSMPRLAPPKPTSMPRSW
jgi:hypothetical protein